MAAFMGIPSLESGSALPVTAGQDADEAGEEGNLSAKNITRGEMSAQIKPASRKTPLEISVQFGGASLIGYPTS